LYLDATAELEGIPERATSALVILLAFAGVFVLSFGGSFDRDTEAQRNNGEDELAAPSGRPTVAWVFNPCWRRRIVGTSETENTF